MLAIAKNGQNPSAELHEGDVHLHWGICKLARMVRSAGLRSECVTSAVSGSGSQRLESGMAMGKLVTAHGFEMIQN